MKTTNIFFLHIASGLKTYLLPLALVLATMLLPATASAYTTSTISLSSSNQNTSASTSENVPGSSLSWAFSGQTWNSGYVAIARNGSITFSINGIKVTKVVLGFNNSYLNKGTWSATKYDSQSSFSNGTWQGVATSELVLSQTGISAANIKSLTITYEEIAVTGVGISSNSATITLGDEPLQLSATISPANASIKTVEWTSQDTNVAIVSQDGLVTAVAPGQTIITVRSTRDQSKTATCSVTVVRPITVIFNSGAGTCITENIEFNGIGQGITLPTAEIGLNGWEFVGWSTESVAETTTVPSLLTGIYHPTADITLYAVYKYVHQGAGVAANTALTARTDKEFTVEDKKPVTCRFSVADASGSPAVMASGSTLTVNCSVMPICRISLNGVSGYPISNLTANGGVLSASGNNGTWEGSASSVVFTASAPVRISSIVVHYAYLDTYNSNPEAVALLDPQLNVMEPACVVYTGEAFTMPQPVTLSDAPIVYFTDDASVAEFTDGVLTINGLGTAIIYANQSLTDDYRGASTQLMLKVVADELTVTTNSIGWATFAPSCDVTLPDDEDVYIYYIKEVTSDNSAISYATTVNAKDDLGDDTLARGTGILIKTVNPNTTVTFAGSPETDPDMIWDKTSLKNLLTGVVSATHVDNIDSDCANYIFANKEEAGLGFYRWTSGTLAANKCYLQLPLDNNGTAPKVVLMNFNDTPTALDSLFYDEDDDAPIYTPLGIRVDKNYRGLVIKRGKKYINR